MFMDGRAYGKKYVVAASWSPLTLRVPTLVLPCNGFRSLSSLRTSSSAAIRTPSSMPLLYLSVATSWV